MLSRTVQCELPEGKLAAGLKAIQDRFAAVEIGSYPSYRAGGFGVAVVLRTPDAEALAAATDAVAGLVRELGDTPHVLDKPEDT